MQPAQLHPNEAKRLESLRAFEILDTHGEEAYDEITLLASEIAGTEIALVSLIDEDRQWFKSRHGLDAAETPRDLAFCAHAILLPDEPFVVEDASRDQRFHDNPLVTNDPSIRFYAGIPLRSPVDNMPLGTLCAISPRVMRLSDEKVEQLRILARQVERLLALRRANIDLKAHASALEAARIVAERANEAKTRFLATISHDMRTPLNGLLGSLNLLEEEINCSDQQALAVTAQSCGKVLLRLVNDTLDLSKIESGSIELAEEPFSPATLIEETATVVRATLTEKPVELDVEIDVNTPEFLRGDKLRCQQVVLNLLSNAAKFTETGRISIRSMDDEGMWVVTVSDMGPGIDTEDFQRIFEPYTQSRSGRLNQSGGAGLGLSICKRICTLLGGDISVSSTVGVGSTFTARMELPVTEHDEASPESCSELPPMTVLIAEDDRVCREILQAQLRRLGCEVISASDGESALELIREGEFDVAILDFNMPGHTGPEIAAAYRNLEADNERMPIIALTGSGFDEDRKTCEEAGMDEMLTKPIDQKGLAGVLQRIYNTKRKNEDYVDLSVPVSTFGIVDERVDV